MVGGDQQMKQKVAICFSIYVIFSINITAYHLVISITSNTLGKAVRKLPTVVGIKTWIIWGQISSKATENAPESCRQNLACHKLEYGSSLMHRYSKFRFTKSRKYIGWQPA